MIKNPEKPKNFDDEWANADQIIMRLPFLSQLEVNEMFLRNRAREINPRTQLPWIPKPIKGRFRLVETVTGLIEWFAIKAAQNDGLPSSYDSMDAMANAALGVSKPFIKWALKHGAEKAQLSGSRIDPRPILAKLAEISNLVASGKIKIKSGEKAINGQYERDRLAQQLADEKEMSNAKERGQILYARDQMKAIGELEATQILFDQFLVPFKKDLLEMAKKLGFYDEMTALLARNLKNLPVEQKEGV